MTSFDVWASMEAAKGLGGELYGEEMRLKTLADVRRHAADVEQADDCTQLLIHYRG